LLGIVIPTTSPATNLAKTVAKAKYILIDYLHGMQGVSGSNPLIRNTLRKVDHFFVK